MHPPITEIVHDRLAHITHDSQPVGRPADRDRGSQRRLQAACRPPGRAHHARHAGDYCQGLPGCGRGHAAHAHPRCARPPQPGCGRLPRGPARRAPGRGRCHGHPNHQRSRSRLPGPSADRHGGGIAARGRLHRSARGGQARDRRRGAAALLHRPGPAPHHGAGHPVRRGRPAPLAGLARQWCGALCAVVPAVRAGPLQRGPDLQPARPAAVSERP